MKKTIIITNFNNRKSIIILYNKLINNLLTKKRKCKFNN